MNAKSIRLEAIRLAVSLDPGDTSTLLGYADSIEQFIQRGVERAVAEDPLWELRRTVGRIEARLLASEAQEKLKGYAEATAVEPYDETFSKGKVGARAAKPARKPRVVAKPPQKRTGARNK